jgi:hypothetical protein
VAAALGGLVTPVVAAVVMPASTLALVAYTVTALERRDPRRNGRSETGLTPALAETAA